MEVRFAPSWAICGPLCHSLKNLWWFSAMPPGGRAVISSRQQFATATPFGDFSVFACQCFQKCLISVYYGPHFPLVQSTLPVCQLGTFRGRFFFVPSAFTFGTNTEIKCLVSVYHGPHFPLVQSTLSLSYIYLFAYSILYHNICR